VFSPDPECPEELTYSWHLEGSELQLTGIFDKCPDRAFHLVQRP
jgi:hypothetical protein